MSEMLDRSNELRNDANVHYNCAQGVFVPFAEKQGLTFEQANAIAENFGGGMRVGLTCGAITGGLMALGLSGAGDARTAAEFVRRMAEKHSGDTECRNLLMNEVHSPAEKKPHCDGMVYEAVEIVEEILASKQTEA